MADLDPPPFGESLDEKRPVPDPLSNPLNNPSLIHINPLDLIGWLAQKTTGDLMFPMKRLDAYRRDRAVMDEMAKNAPQEPLGLRGSKE